MLCYLDVHRILAYPLSRRFVTIADAIATAIICVATLDGTLAWVSSRLRAATGLGRSDLLEGWRQLVHPDDWPHLKGILKTSAAKRLPFAVSFWLRLREDYSWVYTYGVPVCSEQHLLYLVAGAPLRPGVPLVDLPAVVEHVLYHASVAAGRSA